MFCGPADRRSVSTGRSAIRVAPDLWPANLYPDSHIRSLGLEGDPEVRRLLRMALRDAWPAARRFKWQVGPLCEMLPEEEEVGYSGEDGTMFVKVRDSSQSKGRFYPYSFVLATLLHELTHLTHLGHGKAFYRMLAEAAAICGADHAIRSEVRMHIGAELLNAVCDNDVRRARALLSVIPEAVGCRLPHAGNQLPLDYAAHHGRVALTRLLLEARADADATCRSDGIPPLVRAAARGNAKTALVLLKAGASRGRDALDDSVFQATAAANSMGKYCADSNSICEMKHDAPIRLAASTRRRRCVGTSMLRRVESLPLLSTKESYVVHPGLATTAKLDRSTIRRVNLSGSLAL